MVESFIPYTKPLAAKATTRPVFTDNGAYPTFHSWGDDCFMNSSHMVGKVIFPMECSCLFRSILACFIIVVKTFLTTPNSIENIRRSSRLLALVLPCGTRTHTGDCTQLSHVSSKLLQSGSSPSSWCSSNGFSSKAKV